MTLHLETVFVSKMHIRNESGGRKEFCVGGVKVGN